MFKMLVWFLVILAVTADYGDVNVAARFWYWSSRYWYSLSRFAGGLGLASEKHYYDEMDSVNG